MPPASANFAEVHRRESAEQGRKNAPSENTTREFLNYGGIPAKHWVDALGVGERRIQKWRSGEEPVPESRRLEIFFKFQDLVTQQMIAIQEMQARAVREIYGAADPGTF